MKSLFSRAPFSLAPFSLAPFSLALIAGLLLAANGAMAFRPHARPLPMPRPRPPESQPVAFPSLDQMDAGACAVLANIMTSPEAAKQMKALSRKGGQLRGIKCMPRRGREEQTIEFTYQTVGHPFGPPKPMWKATFKVQMFLPQDAGWQIGEVGAIEMQQR